MTPSGDMLSQHVRLIVVRRGNRSAINAREALVSASQPPRSSDSKVALANHVVKAVRSTSSVTCGERGRGQSEDENA